MSDPLRVILLTALAGAAIPLGGALAAVERLQPRWLERDLRHGVMAFGAGGLIAAVALILVPDAATGLPPWLIAASMIAGGLLFLVIDLLLDRTRTHASHLAAMLTDYVPEAVALGATLATNGTGLLLAALIFVQNLPSAFSSFRELHEGRRDWRGLRGTTLLGYTLIVPLGPAAGLLGYYLLHDRPTARHVIMLIAAAGILYLVFQDIAPRARLKRHWAPSLGAVLGFLTGVIGHELVA